MAMSENATAIVLAGGRSSRFGTDKLAVDVDGEPLLYRAIRAVSDVCAEVLVVGPPAGLPVGVPQVAPARLRVILDTVAYEGPLVALAHASRAATVDRLLLVGGDMPALVPVLLQRLLAWDAPLQGACLLLGDKVQPTPLGLDRAATLERSTGLLAAGRRSLRALLASLDLERIPEAEWRALDPDARSLRDIDRPEDLIS
jgi:molybdopterin-guanine dinucleotide biosynthesis protein A